MLEHGADIHAVEEKKKCALHFAAQNDDEDVMRKMIARGVSVHAEDKDGWTPLHMAAYCGNKVAAEILIEEGES